MKLQTSKNLYIASNCSLYVSDDLKTIKAYSYGWWKFVAIDSVGNIIFNNTTYSSSTSGHQSNIGYQLRQLGIKDSLVLNHTRESLCNIHKALNSEIKGIKYEIKKLIKAIKTKGSWRKTNAERRESIKSYLYKIKDLRNIRDNYIDKKPIPEKQKPLSYFKEDGGYNGFERYFLKPNGKLNSNGLLDFLNKNSRWNRAPESIDRLKELFSMTSNHSVEPILLYRFSNDLNNMLPLKDSQEYTQLTAWLKRMAIDKNNLTPMTLDKIHAYLINKTNRKEYVPSEPTALPVHPTLLKLQGTKHLKLIKTDRDLKREGREQSHCIGSKMYMDKMLRGYQALRFKEHTFFLTPDLKLVEAHGKHNKYTPKHIQDELLSLIEAV